MFGKTAFQIFKKANDGVSETQRIALKNGNVSAFEASITRGKPVWDTFLAEGNPSLTTEEQSFLDNETSEYCHMMNDWNLRQTRHIEGEAWEYAKKKKFFALAIPKQYGGLGFSNYAHGQIMARIATRSPTMAAATMVPNSLAGGELFVHYGNQAQKDYYLPRLSDGRLISCFSLTSPVAGSDATGMQDTGTLFMKGNELFMRLNFSKRYCTLAPIANIVQLAVQLRDPDHLLGEKEDLGITVVLMPRDTSGLNIGDRHFPLGSPFPNGPLSGVDVELAMEREVDGVKLDAIMGGREMAGRGWEMLTNCLLIGRAISLPASGSGSAQLATYVSGSYAAMRTQFGLPLSKMEGIQKALAAMAGKLYLIDALRNGPLLDMDLAHAAGKDYRSAVGSTISKLYATELARQVVTNGMDVLAGKAVMDGPTNPIASSYLAIPTGITVEGANIMGENLMAPGMIFTLAHPYVMQEMKVAQDVGNNTITKSEGERQAGKIFMKHAGYVVCNLLRSTVLGITNGWGSSVPRCGPDAKYYRQINRLTSSFAYTVNFSLMMLGKDMQARQRIAARYGAVYSYLYMAGLALRRWDAEGRRDDHRALMEWSAAYCLNMAETALSDLISNHPRQLTKAEKIAQGNPANLSAGKHDVPESTLAKIMLRPFAFPLGRRTKMASDNVERRISVLITTPGEGRDLLLKNVYRPTDAQDPLALHEKAFLMTTDNAHLMYNVAQAQRAGTVIRADNELTVIADAVAKGVITATDAAILEAASKARMSVMLVDQFNGDLNGPGAYGVGSTSSSKSRAA